MKSNYQWVKHNDEWAMAELTETGLHVVFAENLMKANYTGAVPVPSPDELIRNQEWLAVANRTHHANLDRLIEADALEATVAELRKKLAAAERIIGAAAIADAVGEEDENAKEGER